MVIFQGVACISYLRLLKSSTDKIEELIIPQRNDPPLRLFQVSDLNSEIRDLGIDSSLSVKPNDLCDSFCQTLLVIQQGKTLWFRC